MKKRDPQSRAALDAILADIRDTVTELEREMNERRAAAERVCREEREKGLAADRLIQL